MSTLINKFLVSKTVMDDRELMWEQLRAMGKASELFKEPLLMDQNDYYLKIGRFIKFMDNRVESGNPYNTPGVKEVLFRKFRVISEDRWKDYAKFQKAIGYRLSGGRNEFEPELDQIMTQLALMIIFGPGQDRDDAILLDRRGRVVDGAARLKAVRTLPNSAFHTIMIDYEHPNDARDSSLAF